MGQNFVGDPVTKASFYTKGFTYRYVNFSRIKHLPLLHPACIPKVLYFTDDHHLFLYVAAITAVCSRKGAYHTPPYLSKHFLFPLLIPHLLLNFYKCLFSSRANCLTDCIRLH